MKRLQINIDESVDILKALSNHTRIDILHQLKGSPKNVNEISQALDIPFSTAASNVSILEKAGLIKSELIPGRGNQKVNSRIYDQISIDLIEKEPVLDDQLTLELEVGDFVQCDVEQTCGLLSEKGIIHMLDDPRSFYELERRDAQLIWFRSGFVEYHFPNKIPYGTVVKELSFSIEICSEAPYYNLDWPSDITCSINGREIGIWTSPSDFGGERGFLTPNWWDTNNTQYGVLKYWKVNQEGSFIDGVKISDITIDDLMILDQPFISLKLGVNKDSKNVGGINIFGSKFGNYEQGLIMRIDYSRL